MDRQPDRQPTEPFGMAGRAEPPPLTAKQRRLLYVAVIALLLLVPLVALLFQGSERPFAALDASQIASATVEIPPGPLVTLDRSGIEDLVSILQALKIYPEEPSGSQPGGRSVTFHITLSDGTQHTISTCTPRVAVDGVYHRAAYEPCQALSSLGEQLAGVS